MKTKVNILFWLLNLVAVFVIAQRPDSIGMPGLDGKTLPDSLPIARPNLDLNSGLATPNVATDTFKLDVASIDISSDGVDEQIEYNAQDSMFFDIENKKILLWGEAVVKYQTMTIEAAHIVIDWENNTMYAEGREEGKEVIGKPKFTEKETSFDSDRMTYNFKTQKGIIHQAITKQEGMNVVGQKTKFIGGGEDTTKTDVIYSKNAIFTTCELDHPHFGIRSRKQKVVPDKVVVIGPSNVEIAGVPTPLVLPFGFFPLKQGRRTGLIFPQNYQYNITDGYGLDGVGWFFPINDYMNLKVTGSIYFRGTFGVNALSEYVKKYKNSGTLSLGYFRRRAESSDGRSVFNPAYSLVWNHRQDSKAHPYQTFGGGINIQTSNFRSQTNNDAGSVLKSTLTSNLSYSYNFQGPFKLSTSFRHSQNTQTRRMTINFPDINFQTETIYPFKNKERGGNEEKWYEKISFRYVGEAKNTFTTTDTTLFSQQTIDDARYGIRHSVTPSMSFTLAKFFNVTPSANYKEVWYFQTVDKTFDENNLLIERDTFFADDESGDFEVVEDTLRYGKIDTTLVNGFKPYRQFTTGISVNTQLFGTVLFKKGFLRGLRHVAKPSISFNFSPDYTNPDWGYFKSVRRDLREDEEIDYTIFEQGIYDKPNINAKRQMALSYGLNNIFEAKIFSKKDSTARNIKLLKNMSLRGDYNFAADSLKFSEVRITGNTSFFNNITNLTFNIRYDPYDADSTRRNRINTFYYDNTGKYLRFVQADFRLSTRLTVKKIRDFFKGKDTQADPTTVSDPNSPARQQGDRSNLPQLGDSPPPSDGRGAAQSPPESLLDLFENFSINHNFTVTRSFINTVDSTRISTHSIDMRGQLQLSENWNINVGNIGYDFVSKRVTYPSLGFSRDLHCWEMGVQWAPQRDAYAFYIRVKPGRLDFLNIPYNKGNAGAGFGGFGARGF